MFHLKLPEIFHVYDKLAFRPIIRPTRNTHTQPFYGSVDFVRDNPGEQVPEETFTHSHSSWSSNIPIFLLHLLRSMASSLFNPRVLQSFSTVSLQVFGRPYYRSSLCYSVSSVCRLSICPSSVTFCIVAKRCVLAKKCLKE